MQFYHHAAGTGLLCDLTIISISGRLSGESLPEAAVIRSIRVAELHTFSVLNSQTRSFCTIKATRKQ